MPKPSSPFRGTFILRRIEELRNQGIKPIVVTTEHLINIYKYKKNYNFKDLGYQVDQNVRTLIKIENPYTYTNFLKKRNINELEKIVKENNIDLIHAHFIRDGGYALEIKKRIKIPYVVTLHGYDIIEAPHYSRKAKSQMLNVLENADKCIFVSKFLLNEAKSLGYKQNNYEVIYNGFSRTVFYKDENIGKTEKDYFTLGFCGNFIKRKRADKLPYIFHLVKNKLPNTKFIIIGDGSLKQKMIKEFSKYKLLDSVVFTGNIRQELIAQYMNLMDVFILPSVKEGYGAVIGESLACGTQVVTSDAGGIPEAVGNAGYLVANGDNFEERFAEKVIYALSNPIPQSTIDERAKELTWEKTVKYEIEVYKKILSM